MVDVAWLRIGRLGLNPRSGQSQSSFQASEGTENDLKRHKTFFKKLQLKTEF